MPLHIVRADITTMQVDAIVNAANTSLLGGGGVDGAIHRAAGKELLAECRTLGGCDVGKAKITKGYKLPCRYVIHTVGPIYKDGHSGEDTLLASCYRESLRLAVEHGCSSVAFPLISTGAYGYPVEEGVEIASDTIKAFLRDNEMTVYLVVFDRKAVLISEALFSDICSFIDDRYVETHYIANRPDRRRGMFAASLRMDAEECAAPEVLKCAPCAEASLEELLGQVDESFSQMLLRKIDESALTDVQCYKRANIDRKLFSKIRSNPDYKPGKSTVLAFAIALELSLPETKELLMKAGYALSDASKADIIVEFFISKGIYDIFTINNALFEFDQTPLGA